MQFRTVFTAALLGSAITLAGVLPASAENTTLYINNETSTYLTISVDGNYGCNTAGNTSCTIPVTVGTHHLRAVRTEDGAELNTTANIGSGGYTWTLTEK